MKLSKKMSPPTTATEDVPSSDQSDRGIQQLKESLLLMGSLAERAVYLSVTALLDSDDALAEHVLHEEAAVNDLHIEIDDGVIRLLAAQHLNGAQLRFALTVTRINSNLERIGDQAVNISEAVLRIMEYPRVKPYIDLPKMSAIAKEMVRDSLNALVNHDEELAKSVLVKDDQLDALRDQNYQVLLTYISGNPLLVLPTFDLILVTKDLERIGDLATNIAEEVIYVVAGRDVRHQSNRASL
jgi:phosphate transport system protein